MGLCGLELPEDPEFDGMDLSPFLREDGSANWTERTLFVHHQGRFGVKVEDGRARLKAGEVEKIQKVKPGQKEVVFELDLEPGDINLQTWLIDHAGVERGSYYVYIR